MEEFSNIVWCLDTEANNITSNNNLFSELDKLVILKFKFGDDSAIKIKGIGMIVLE